MLTFLGEGKELKDVEPFTDIVVTTKNGQSFKAKFMGYQDFSQKNSKLYPENYQYILLAIAIQPEDGFGYHDDCICVANIASISLE